MGRIAMGMAKSMRGVDGVEKAWHGEGIKSCSQGNLAAMSAYE